MERIDLDRPQESFCSQICSWFSTDDAVTLDDGRRLVLHGLIAEGGFSYVYRASVDEHDVAAKKIVTMDQEQVLDVQSEVDAHREHQHVRLMPLIATGERQQSNHREFFLVFPLCGSSLREEIDASTLQGRPWSQGRVLRVFREVTEGLQYLHTREPAVAHRDVKPENILFKGGSVLLMDFGSMGVAQRSAETRRLAMAIQEEAAEQCTMPWRAPELWDVQTGSRVDEKVDVWSLGAVLYAMVYGFSPFECDFPPGAHEPRIVETSYLKVLAKVAYPDRAGFDDAFMELMKACLRHKPAERPSTTELLAMIDDVLSKMV